MWRGEDARKKKERKRQGLFSRGWSFIKAIRPYLALSFRERGSDVVFNNAKTPPGAMWPKEAGALVPSLERLSDDPDEEVRFYALVGDLDISP